MLGLYLQKSKYFQPHLPCLLNLQQSSIPQLSNYTARTVSSVGRDGVGVWESVRRFTTTPEKSGILRYGSLIKREPGSPDTPKWSCGQITRWSGSSRELRHEVRAEANWAREDLERSCHRQEQQTQISLSLEISNVSPVGAETSPGPRSDEKDSLAKVGTIKIKRRAEPALFLSSHPRL